MRRKKQVVNGCKIPFYQAMFEYMAVILIVLDGNSVYRHNINQNYHFALLADIVLLALLLIISKGKFNRRNLSIVVLIEFWCLLYFVVMNSKIDNENYITLFLIGLPLLYLVFADYYQKGNQFVLLYRIETIVVLFAIISLILWLLGSVFGIVSPNSRVLINWGKEKWVNGYFGLQFETAYDTTFGIQLYRNSGIFTEAPMFNLWLDIALAIELFLKEKRSKLKIIILVTTILSTLSSTGLVFLATCVILKYFHNLKELSKQKKIVLFVAGMLAVPVGIMLIKKLIETKSNTVSFLMRFQDYAAGFTVWKANPILGSGFGNLSALYPYTYATLHGIKDTGYSNSLLGLLATGGIWISLLFVLGFVGMITCKQYKGLKVKAFGICYLLLFILTIYFARYISIFLVALGLLLFTETYNIRVIRDNSL